MKRTWKKIVSVILSMTLAIGLLAGTAAETKTAEAATAAAITPPTVTDYSTLSSIAYAQTTVTLAGKPETAPNAIVPVNVSDAGTIEVAAVTASGSALGTITMGLYSDQGCTSVVDTATLTGSSGVAKCFYVEQAATYYLQFKWSSSVPAQAATIRVGAVFYKGSETTLTNVFQPIFVGNQSKTLYHKLVMKKTGLVSISGMEYRSSGNSLSASSLTYTLYNAKKKPVHSGSSLSALNNYTENFTLKKGIYYVGVATSQRYQLKAEKNTKWKDQSGKSKKKARKIKKGKTATGMILMSDKIKKADWYQVKLSKRSKLQINISAVSTGTVSNLKMQIIPKNRHQTLLGSSTLFGNTGRKLKSRGKLSAGTYYIKVTKISKDASGLYRIKFKK